MILTTLFIITLLILALVLIFTVATGGLALILVFGDLIIFVLIVIMVIKIIKKMKGNNDKKK